MMGLGALVLKLILEYFEYQAHIRTCTHKHTHTHTHTHTCTHIHTHTHTHTYTHTHTQADGSTESLIHGLLLVLLLLLPILVCSFCLQHSDHVMVQLSIQARAALVAEVMKTPF
jgi:hypothetical protein